MKLLETGPSPRGWHRIQTMLQCPQKYAYTYETEGGREKTTSPPLIKGTLMHLALAHHYMRQKNEANGGDPKEWLPPKQAVEMMAIKEGGEWEEHINTVNDCYDAYVAYWVHDAFKVLEVEQLAYAKIGPYALTGRFDLVMEDSRGGVWVVDHKTTTRIHANQRKFYSISGQLIGYAHMARQHYGARFKGVLLNQIQHKAPCKFTRIELPPAPNLIKKFPSIIIDAEERIAHLQKTRKPDDYPLAANELTCFHRYGACDFLERCKWGYKKS